MSLWLKNIVEHDHIVQCTKTLSRVFCKAWNNVAVASCQVHIVIMLSKPRHGHRASILHSIAEDCSASCRSGSWCTGRQAVGLLRTQKVGAEVDIVVIADVLTHGIKCRRDVPSINQLEWHRLHCYEWHHQQQLRMEGRHPTSWVLCWRTFKTCWQLFYSGASQEYSSARPVVAVLQDLLCKLCRWWGLCGTTLYQDAPDKEFHCFGHTAFKQGFHFSVR